MRELLRSVDAYELAEWYVYENLEIFRENIRQQEMTDDEKAAETLKALFGNRT